MIYVNPLGRLGNLMFINAAAISFAKKNNTNYSICNLENHIKWISNSYNKQWADEDYKKYIFNGVDSKCYNGKLNEYNFPFHFEEIKLEHNDCLIKGHFQSELYFIDYKDLILKQFEEKKEITEIINKKYDTKLKNKTTSIHIRRTDYVHLSNHHPFPGIEYYKNSIDILSKETDMFLIFSDDPEWAEENISQLHKNTKIIREEKDYIEMYLMARCNNNIIANSSFSWWGAYLNNNKNKKVIAPQKWFGKAYDGICDYKDVIPKSWIKI